MQVHIDNDADTTLAIVSEDNNIQNITYQHQQPDDAQTTLAIITDGTKLENVHYQSEQPPDDQYVIEERNYGEELGLKSEDKPLVVDPVEHVVLIGGDMKEPISESEQFMPDETEQHINVVDVV